MPRCAGTPRPPSGLAQATVARGEVPNSQVVEGHETALGVLLAFDDKNAAVTLELMMGSLKGLRQAIEKVATIHALAEDEPFPQSGQPRVVAQLMGVGSVELVVLGQLRRALLASLVLEGRQVVEFGIAHELGADAVESEGFLTNEAALTLLCFLEKRSNSDQSWWKSAADLSLTPSGAST